MAVNQITEVRLPDGQEVPIVDWSHRPLYSTVDLFSGFDDLEVRAFNYASTDNVSTTGNKDFTRTATLADTNIANPSEMDSTEEFLVYGISIEIFQVRSDGSGIVVDEAGLPVPVAPNVAELHRRLVAELEVSEKAFPQAPIGFFPAGLGPHIEANGQARSFATNGYPSYEAVEDLVIPAHLGGTEDFAILFQNETGTAFNFLDDSGGNDNDAMILLRTYFRGLHKRPTA